MATVVVLLQHCREDMERSMMYTQLKVTPSRGHRKGCSGGGSVFVCMFMMFYVGLLK